MQTKDVLTDKSSHDEYFSDISDKFLVLKNQANKLGVNVVLKKWVAPDFNLKYQLIISKGKKFENDVDITLEAALLRNFIKAFFRSLSSTYRVKNYNTPHDFDVEKQNSLSVETIKNRLQFNNINPVLFKIYLDDKDKLKDNFLVISYPDLDKNIQVNFENEGERKAAVKILSCAKNQNVPYLRFLNGDIKYVFSTTNDNEILSYFKSKSESVILGDAENFNRRCFMSENNKEVDAKFPFLSFYHSNDTNQNFVRDIFDIVPIQKIWFLILVRNLTNDQSLTIKNIIPQRMNAIQINKKETSRSKPRIVLTAKQLIEDFIKIAKQNQDFGRFRFSDMDKYDLSSVIPKIYDSSETKNIIWDAENKASLHAGNIVLNQIRKLTK